MPTSPEDKREFRAKMKATNPEWVAREATRSRARNATIAKRKYPETRSQAIARKKREREKQP